MNNLKGEKCKNLFKKSTNGISLISFILIIILLLIIVGVVIAIIFINNNHLENNTIGAENIDTTEVAQENDNTTTERIVVEGVTIPNGFYHIEGTTIDTGFAISDVEGDTLENTAGGNQYVWIPVDGILGEDGTIEDVTGSEKKILLGRYSFNKSGIPREFSGDFVEETKNEHDQDEYQNVVANDIDAFIDSVKENGGYYIARFEASQGTNDKAESKFNKPVWHEIVQASAAESCQNLYDGVNSDLMNSYAWDTAILFIQKYGQNDYSMQNGPEINSSEQTSGTSGDIQLNICDMAGNYSEWTTETFDDSNFPCVHRGSSYLNENSYTSFKLFERAEYTCSFRPLLYL